MESYTADYEELLLRVALSLNEFHGTSFSLRAWRVILGPWLGALLGSWAEAVAAVSAAEQVHGLNSWAQLPAVDLVRLRPFDYQEAFRSITEADEWSDYVYGLAVANHSTMRVVDVPHSETCRNQGTGVPRYPSIDSRSRSSRSARILASTMRLVHRRSKNVLYGTHLSRWTSAALELSLGQFPGVARSRGSDYLLGPTSRSAAPPRWLTRDDGRIRGTATLDTLVEGFVPRLYLEEFGQLRDAVERVGLPKSPRVIYTSGGLTSDEVFKAYTARNVDSGARLLVSQHGGGYGVYARMPLEDHERMSADSFLSWGSGIDNAPGDVLPTGLLAGPARSAGKRRLLRRPTTGRIVLVMQNYPLRAYRLASHPIGDQWYQYFRDQLDFVRSLNPAVRSGLSVRLYPQDYERDQAGLWRLAFPEVEQLPEGESFVGIRSQAKLLVLGYNSTEFLISLTSQTPTIVFFDPELWEMREEAQVATEVLREAGVLHDSPESAAHFINAHIGDLPGWWRSNEVEAARKAAARNLAFRPRSVVRALLPAFRQWAD